MNRQSMEALKLDRRLVRRRGWITKEEFARALEALPDVAQKARTLEEEPVPDAEAPPESPAGY